MVAGNLFMASANAGAFLFIERAKHGITVVITNIHDGILNNIIMCIKQAWRMSPPTDFLAQVFDPVAITDAGQVQWYF
jgi:hypothetical protein